MSRDDSIPFPNMPVPPRDGTHEESFEESDQTRVEGEYRDGLRTGSWKWYHDNGQLRADYEYDRGVKHGHELDWAENGTQICEGENDRGTRTGTWTWWHDNGEYRYAHHYDENGEKHGEYAWDLEDGSERARGAYWHGKRHGSWVWHHEPNHWKMIRGYHRGFQHGEDAGWYTEDQLAYRRFWRYGSKHGPEEKFRSDGSPQFRGEWHGGFPVGDHVTWDDEGNETVETFVNGLPVEFAEDAKKLERIAKKIRKADDDYKRENVVRDSADYGERAPLLVHLWREGHYDVPSDPALWGILADGAGLLDGADVVEFLKTATNEDVSGNHLPYWDGRLDRLVMEVYERDPDPIDEAFDDLPDLNRKGVAFVRARWGKETGDVLSDELGALVAKHIDEYGINERIRWPEDGHVEEQRLFEDYHGTPTELWDEFLQIFTTPERWVEALRQKARAQIDDDGGRLEFAKFRPLVEAAEPELLVELFGQMSLNNMTETLAEKALLEWRDDDGETITEIALGIDDTGLRKWPAMCCALLKLDEEGNEPPRELIDNFVLASESPTYSSQWFTNPLNSLPDDSMKFDPAFIAEYIPLSPGCSVPRAELMHRALRTLPADDVRSIIERYQKSDYSKIHGAQYLYLVDDPEFWSSFIPTLEDDNYGHTEKYMWGVADIGLPVVPLLEEFLDDAPNADFESGYRQAIVVALALASDNGETIDEAYDEHVRFDTPSDNYKFQFFRPYLQRLIHRLPSQRAEKLLIDGLRSSHFSRAFRFIGSHPTPAVLEVAFTELLEREAKFNHEQKQDVEHGLRGLPDAEPWIEWFLRSGGGAGTRDTLKSVVGWKEFEALEERLAEDDVEPAKELDQIDKILLRAEELGGDGDRIYLLRRHDEDPGYDDYNLIGGAAPGVDAERWPTFDDEPMAHLFTLDLETMPELASRYDDGYRTISVFCHSPDYNEAWEPGNPQTAVLFTTEDQLADDVAAPDEAPDRGRAWFEAVAVDLPASFWSEGGELKTEIYRAGARVLGPPMWLQSEEYWGDFVMQFDESFVYTNLGDMGIMYTFSDTAFWQCH